MNDVERDLRELFERKASSAGGVAPQLPESVRRRGRRRQLGTALVSGLTALAVLAGTAGVLRAVDTGRGREPTPVDDPWAGYEVFERTAAVGNFTITSPSDWYLVNQWPWARTVASSLRKQRERAVEACGEEPTQDERQTCRSSLMGVPGDGFVAPILMLSDTDRGLESSPCFDRSFSIGPEEAVMTIALDSLFMATYFGAGDRAQWPVPFDTSPAADRPPCGPGTYVYFAAGDLPYVAHFAFGDAVPEDERQTLIDSFEGMQVDDSGEVFMEEPQQDDTAAYVIAGGKNAAGPWRLELTRSTSDGPRANVDLSVVSPEGRAGAADFTVPDAEMIEQSGGDPVFGAVTKEAVAVELRLEEGTPPIPAQLIPLPPSMPFDFDLFFASNDADVQATAVAVDGNGVSIEGSPTAATDPQTQTATFLNEVEHLPEGERWAPRTKREVDQVVMPVTFPDGASAELLYPPDLHLEQMNFYPDTYGVLDEKSSSCGWPVHASRSDPRGGWIRGNGPLDRFESPTGDVVELWEGTRSSEPFNFLITRAGSWNVIVPCQAITSIAGQTLSWAELITAAESRDGFLVFEDALPLDMHLRGEGATIRMSDADVVVDISSGKARCDADRPDLGAHDGVVQWCLEPAGGVYVYANAFEPRGEILLEHLVSGLEIRNYRPGSN